MRILKGVLLPVALLAVACRTTPNTVAPPPSAHGALVDSLPTLEPSIVEAPVTYDLRAARTALEAVVPDRFGDIEHRMEIPGNGRVHVAFAATRDPLKIRVLGDSIELTTLVRYQGRGWYKAPIAPEISASCGTGSDPPRVRVRLIAQIHLTRRGTLDVRTHLRDLVPATDSVRDACRVTFLKVNVTDRVLSAVRSPIENKLLEVDKKITRIDLRSRLEQVWMILQRPIHVSDSLWLMLDPQTVRIGTLSGDGTRLTAPVGLTAAPRIVSGLRPPDGTLPLPPLERAPPANQTAHLVIEGQLGYDVASDILERALKGKSFSKGPRTFVLDGARVYPLGDGRVALRVRVTGDAKGTYYLVGTPKYDAKSGELQVPDLDFDVATDDILVRSAAWLARDQVRDFLREHAHWPAAGLLEQARERAERAINRELTKGVELAGTLSAGQVLAVRALRVALVVRAHADGTLRVDIDRELPVVTKLKEQRRREKAATRAKETPKR